MAINNTTLTYAITQNATTFAIGSTTNVVAPTATTGAGSYLYVGSEFMQVVAIPAVGMVTVVRGAGGSLAEAHTAASPVLIGQSTDFPLFTPEIAAFQVRKLTRYTGMYSPVAAAASITAPGATFHVTGTTTINIINPPANFVEGQITVIPDGAFTWASSAVQYGLADSGVASVGSTIIFTYDAATKLWYPTGDNASTTLSASTPAAATLVAPGTTFHVTGTTATNIITPPTNFSQSQITIIADGIWTWTSSAVAHGIAQSGTVTSAGETVTFTYDPATTYWYPSRVA